MLDHVRSQLGADHRIEELAARACMSPRHFARCFKDETGTTPAHAIERLRVEAARAALESGHPSVQRIAQDCGFGNTERMRRSFVRLLGRPPASVRKRGPAGPSAADGAQGAGKGGKARATPAASSLASAKRALRSR
jgi:transcriptional regulator GlxA family with amidase domain